MIDRSTDEDLLNDFVRGRAAALGELAQRHERSLLGLAIGLCGGREDLARDAVQDAWVRVIKYGKRFDGRSSVRTWLYRIVVNRCLDLRQKLTLSTLPTDALASTPTLNVKDVASANSEVRAAVDGLSSGARLVVLLCYHHDLTHEQVAEILGVPLGTVKSRLHGALTKLRAELGIDETTQKE